LPANRSFAVATAQKIRHGPNCSRSRARHPAKI